MFDSFRDFSERFGFVKTLLVGIAGVITALTVIIGGGVKAVKAVDSRYMQAADAKKFEERFNQQQSRTDFQVNDLKIGQFRVERELLRNKKFDIEESCRAPRTCSVEARQRISDLSDQIDDISRSIRRLGGR